MIKDIVTDSLFLSRKSLETTAIDNATVTDLLDTIKAHQDHCVGMAANMIGVLKRIIVIYDGQDYLVMYNPVIIKTTGVSYITQEGCLSHQGVKQIKRYPKIKVEYLDITYKKKIKTFCDYPAQIIQHEIDHCNGILI